MEMDDFNALGLRYGDLIKVEMKPEEELEAAGRYPPQAPAEPRAGYLAWLFHHGYSVSLDICSVPDGWASKVCADVRDVKSITVFERAKEGKLALLAKREDGQGVTIASKFENGLNQGEKNYLAGLKASIPDGQASPL